MAGNPTESDLSKMGLVEISPGVFGKPAKPHPAKKMVNHLHDPHPKTHLLTGTLPDSEKTAMQILIADPLAKTGFRHTYNIANIESPTQLRRLSLCLFGEPMPKQSVRSFATGRKNAKGTLIVDHFQPAKMGQRVKDYQRQIREQLPPEFEMFAKIVHIRKMHFVFCPLKSFSKNKMDRIAVGEIFYKATRPDLPDNLKKLVNDAMSELVYKDDGIIVSEDNVKKYYGTGGCIIIELEGY